MKQKVTYFVTGIVQGVGYRYFVYQQARIYGFCGYTKNKYDGSVEVCIDIAKDQVSVFRNILKNNCTRAHVDEVTYTIEDKAFGFKDFKVY